MCPLLICCYRPDHLTSSVPSLGVFSLSSGPTCSPGPYLRVSGSYPTVYVRFIYGIYVLVPVYMFGMKEWRKLNSCSPVRAKGDWRISRQRYKEIWRGSKNNNNTPPAPPVKFVPTSIPWELSGPRNSIEITQTCYYFFFLKMVRFVFLFYSVQRRKPFHETFK